MRVAKRRDSLGLTGLSWRSTLSAGLELVALEHD
jgi:hypothetical protein